MYSISYISFFAINLAIANIYTLQHANPLAWTSHNSLRQALPTIGAKKEQLHFKQ